MFSLPNVAVFRHSVASPAGWGAPLRFGVNSKNPKVREAYERLNPQERWQLTKAFRAWVQKDCLGFTMLGYKPMSYLEEVSNPAPILKLWKKISGLMNREHFIFQTIRGWDYLFFAHKEAMKAKMTRHTALFQKAAEAKLSPEELLSSLERSRPVNNRHFFNHLLQGIMLGFGAKNAALFARRSEMDIRSDYISAYETTLVRQGPTKELTGKQFADVSGAFDFYLSQSPLWEKQFQSPEHRAQVAQAVDKFKAMNPAQGIPKAAAFDILDLVFNPGTAPAKSKTAPDAETLKLYQNLEEGGFQGSEHRFAGPDFEPRRLVRIPYFMALTDDREPADMMARSLARLDAMESWVKSRGFFRSLLETLMGDNPSEILENELDKHVRECR